MRESRQRKKDAGLVLFSAWVTPERAKLFKALEARGKRIDEQAIKK